MKFGLHGCVPWSWGIPGLLARQGNLCHPEELQNRLEEHQLSEGLIGIISANCCQSTWRRNQGCDALPITSVYHQAIVTVKTAWKPTAHVKDFHTLTKADQGEGERQSQHLVNQLGLTAGKMHLQESQTTKRKKTQNSVFSKWPIPLIWAPMVRIPSILSGGICMQPEECAWVQRLAPAQSGGE